MTERVNRIMDPELRYHRGRDYTRAEIQAFEAELVETGADIGGGPYPVRHSVAFRGPEHPIEGPWLNGKLLDESPAPRPIAYADKNNFYHAHYYNQNPTDYYNEYPNYDFYSDSPDFSLRPPRRSNGYGYSRRYNAAQPRVQPQPPEQRQHQRQRRQPQPTQSQSRPRSRPRQMTQEELDAREERRAAYRLAVEEESAHATAMTIVRLDILADEERAAAAAAATAATPSTDATVVNDDDHNDGHVRRRTASAAEDKENANRDRPCSPNESSESESEEDGDVVWVNSEGVPFPPRDKEAERKERRARRALKKERLLAAQRDYPFNKGPLVCANGAAEC